MPASRRARAMILAPRSCPSRPGLATTMRMSSLTCGAYPLPGGPTPPRGRMRAAGEISGAGASGNHSLVGRLRGLLARYRWLLVDAALVVLVAAAAIAVSLWATPMQQVSAAGQTVRVGVAAPTFDLSGPGELDLFGQEIPTTLHFLGPVRPRVALSRITLGEQVAQLTTQDPDVTAHSLENALVSGWKRFFVWQVVVVGLCSIALLGAAAGWLRHGWKRSVGLIVVGLIVAEVINLGAIMTTAYTAPDKLRSIRSLQDLVGGTTTPARRDAATPTRKIGKVVVLGDSTAAGQGNRSVTNPTLDDKVCHRSADSFAEALEQTNGWDVTNLACGGATVAAGILGPQWAGDRMQNAQIDAPAVRRADVVIVDIGANDVRWSDLLALCAAAETCDNDAAQAYFQQQLHGFSRDLLELLTQLQLLSNHPVVLVNQYYDPFDGSTDCLADHGMTEEKKVALET